MQRSFAFDSFEATHSWVHTPWRIILEVVNNLAFLLLERWESSL